MDQLPPSPFTLAQATALGLTRQRLHRMVRGGELNHLLTSVYAVPSRTVDHDLIAAALGLVLPPHHVLVDRSAAMLHGINMFTWSERHPAPAVETAALRGCTRTRRAEARGRVRTLLPCDITSVHGLWVTTPLRTALDLGCCLHRRDAVAALNAFAREHGVSPAQMTAELGRYGGRRGVVQLRELIPLVDSRIESVRESWVWLELIRSGLPRPEPQHWIEIDGVPTYRLDFAYVQQRVAVEYDGEEFHTGDRQRAADEVRRAWLRQNGWTVIVVRKGDFTGRRLDAWLRQVRVALAERPTNRRW